jgi:hypothetical protein
MVLECMQLCCMPAMASSPVLFERKGHVAVFTLNRPSARNAVNAELVSERLIVPLCARNLCAECVWVSAHSMPNPNRPPAARALKRVTGQPS